MTHNLKEPPTPSNKKLWIILAGIITIVIGCSVVGYAMSNNSSPQVPTTPEATQGKTSAKASLKAPVIESAEAQVKGDDLDFTIKIKNADISRAKIEYQIADQDRAVKAEGAERANEFNASVKLASSAYYRLKVRLVNEEGAKSPWSENHTVKLSELKGMKSLEPAKAYYDTGWAKGTAVDSTDAKQAIETAWNIEEVTSQTELMSCLPLNTGDMNPKLLLPPIPSIIPNGTTLKYLVNGWDGEAISITYVWCQQ